METYEPLLPTPNSSDQYNANLKNDHDQKKGYLRGVIAILSPEASPASLFPKPEKEKEQQITAISGLKCLELYNLSNRHTSSLKTCVASLLGTKDWYSNKCALTWKAKVTKSNRLLFQLSPSTRRTAGIGSGLSLATPTVSDASDGIRKSTQQKPGSRHSITLKDDIAMLPTPDSNAGSRGTSKEWKPIRPSGQHAQLTLNDKIKMLPTCQSRDGRGAAVKTRDDIDSLIEMGATKGGTGIKTGLKLQPNFVAWMMGYPQNWATLPAPKPSTEPTN